MPLTKLSFNQTPEAPSLSPEELLGATERNSKYQQLLQWYGILSSIHNDELIGDCPFSDCLKAEKFTMHRQTAQWRCFVCNRNGNAYGLIHELHQNYLQSTTEEQLQALRKIRKNAVDLEEMVDMQLAWNHVTNEWMFPAWNPEGKIVNLYVWRKQFDPTSGKQYNQFMSAPSMSHIPYGIHRLRSGSNRPIWIAEGHWDYLALRGLFRRVELQNSHDVIAAPGAGTFPKKSLNCLNGRDVILVYDNDTAGKTGMENLVNAMATNAIMPLSIRKIEWPPLEAGFDVSDVITKLPKEHWKKEK